ncbi:uncharacterized protein BKCO1_5000121 [Diplodia corticola]|uniref:Uncharacterized protein n=1 Tax=Diplodia corticola TaxID=236234 RepID=A0A1J9R911_9PEZI|nr:uncharacterized protein BKCO1_5000121 [Diplodia corticola]OJD38046.1 hypothetical protein BKCO1_5000121 [Diplodia corticola]
MQRQHGNRFDEDSEQHHDPFRSGSSSSWGQRELPKTPPHQQLVPIEPSAPRKRKAPDFPLFETPSKKRSVPHHPDLMLLERPSLKRAAESDAESPQAAKPYKRMAIAQKPSGGVVAISPAGTICRCHLEHPGAICPHTIYVDDARARAAYEALSPVQQVLERRAVNKDKEKANSVKELMVDAKAVREECEDWLNRENRRQRRRIMWRAITVDRDPFENEWVGVPENYDRAFVVRDHEDSEDGGSSEGSFEIKAEPSEPSDDDSDLSEYDADVDSDEEDDDDDDDEADFV